MSLKSATGQLVSHAESCARSLSCSFVGTRWEYHRCFPPAVATIRAVLPTRSKRSSDMASCVAFISPLAGSFAATRFMPAVMIPFHNG